MQDVMLLLRPKGGELKMLKDELIHLQTKETENGAEIYLDDKLIHHIKDIEIKSSVVTGTAELLIRMKVKYP
jgi:hypothetical protein